jgi:putative two-component system response regulator
MNGDTTARERVLIVDDSDEMRLIVSELLQPRYAPLLASSGREALHLAAQHRPHVILLDIVMPEMDGFEVCRRLKADPQLADVPVIFLTSRDDVTQELAAFRHGAADFVTKPIVPDVLRARVATHVALSVSAAFLKDQNRYLEHRVAERTAEVAALRDATIHAMATLAEFRSNETGNHLRRTAHYVVALANRVKGDPRHAAELTPENIQLLFKSAPLHDIGKVGIADHVLLKPGKLSQEEWQIMKQHPAIGRDAVLAVRRELGSASPFLHFAAQIAYSHHEKWDGSGYPQGLAGEAIPLSARLMAVADVYDALISRRCYKEPMPHAEAIAYIAAGSGGHFDPTLVAALLQGQDEFARIAAQFPDAQA